MECCLMDEKVMLLLLKSFHFFLFFSRPSSLYVLRCWCGKLAGGSGRLASSPDVTTEDLDFFDGDDFTKEAVRRFWETQVK